MRGPNGLKQHSLHLMWVGRAPLPTGSSWEQNIVGQEQSMYMLQCLHRGWKEKAFPRWCAGPSAAWGGCAVLCAWACPSVSPAPNRSDKVETNCCFSSALGESRALRKAVFLHMLGCVHPEMCREFGSWCVMGKGSTTTDSFASF